MIETPDDHPCRRSLRDGIRAVLVKGGHVAGGRSPTCSPMPAASISSVRRIDKASTPGTAAFASAIATGLAQGFTEDAARARNFGGHPDRLRFKMPAGRLSICTIRPSRKGARLINAGGGPVGLISSASWSIISAIRRWLARPPSRFRLAARVAAKPIALHVFERRKIFRQHDLKVPAGNCWNLSRL
jgi:hypothetical protein